MEQTNSPVQQLLTGGYRYWAEWNFWKQSADKFRLIDVVHMNIYIYIDGPLRFYHGESRIFKNLKIKNRGKLNSSLISAMKSPGVNKF